MKTSDFHYDLPPELIAQVPLPERSASRLLVVPPEGGVIDGAIRDLPGFLRAGDLLVFNDTRVIPARLFGHKPSGGRVEILIERLLGGDLAKAQVGASKTPRPGSMIELDGGGQVEVMARDDRGFFTLRFHVDAALADWLQRAGQLPLPPYIARTPDAADTERYQTVFAERAGAVAAPTAGLHFDDALLQSLRDRGIHDARITLHVGAGTFQPVRVENLDDHRMHSEWIDVPQALVDKVRATRAAGGRVIAVGTTVLRALESATAPTGLRPFSGETDIFIHPPITVESVDGLLTNFHLPESTLLMLVSAFAGMDRIRDAYAHAVAARYRFFSYGDAMLLWNHARPGCPHLD